MGGAWGVASARCDGLIAGQRLSSCCALCDSASARGSPRARLWADAQGYWAGRRVTSLPAWPDGGTMLTQFETRSNRAKGSSFIRNSHGCCRASIMAPSSCGTAEWAR